MNETDAELHQLQQLLDDSLQRSTEHLRSIVTPTERTVPAEKLVAVTTGMCTVTLATVTASGEPRISAVDGHFLHGRWVFTTVRQSAKARQLLARPAASVAYVRDEVIGVFSHGYVETLNPTDAQEHPDWPTVHEHLTRHYGGSPLEWGDVVAFRLQPHWMVAYASDPDALGENFGVPART